MSSPASLRSAVPFRDAVSRRRTDALAPARIHQGSQMLGWDGLAAEIGSHEGWVVDDLVVDSYYLALNIDTRPLRIENRERGRFVPRIVPPGTLVLHPFGESFSFRVADAARWGGIILRPSLVRQEPGGPPPGIGAAFGLADPVLLALVRTTLRAAQQGAGQGLLATELGLAMSDRLRQSQGHREGVRPAAGGLPLHKIRRVVDHIEDALAEDLTLAGLAALVGLSPWHFARSFRASTGQSPHQYVLTTRLRRARDLLGRTGMTIADIAAGCGFADHAHLTRCFVRAHGQTPSAFRRRNGPARRLTR